MVMNQNAAAPISARIAADITSLRSIVVLAIRAASFLDAA
jgi:hypothetical protein